MDTKLFILLIGFAVSLNCDDQCGISMSTSSRISDLSSKDELAEDGQWPWAAAVYNKNSSYRSYLCSGTLISDQHVLTAAHCIQNKGSKRFSPDNLSVTLGTADTSGNKGDFRDAIDVKIHPEWDITRNTKYDADLAIIKLSYPVKISFKVRPICLPTSEEKVFEVNGFMAGYGTYSNDHKVDGKLRYLEIPTVTQENCLWHPGGFMKAASMRTFCGGDLSKTACRGDSGAGFVVQSFTFAYKIVGIVSAAILSFDENCRSDSYVVFTNVPLYAHWILTEIGQADKINNEVWHPFDPSTREISEDSIYLDEGDTKSYVARRKISGNLIVGKFIPTWNTIYLPYYGAELRFQDEIEILASNKEHQWIPFTGTFPNNAVQGGYEGDAKLLVGRRMIDGKYIIGKVVDKSKIIYVPYFSKEHEFRDFEILVLGDGPRTSNNSSPSQTPIDSIGWTTFIGQLLADAVSVDEGDVKAFVARRKVDDNLIVGKYIPNWNLVYVTHNGQEQSFHDGFEVLFTNKIHQWIPFTGTIPSNAVEGGYEGSSKLYVGRRMHEGKYIIGKIDEETKTISIGYFSREYKYNDSIDILVESEHVV